jgi:hypothetical protein
MRQLAKIVEGEAFHWGDSVAEDYFVVAQRAFQDQWDSMASSHAHNVLSMSA